MGNFPTSLFKPPSTQFDKIIVQNPFFMNYEVLYSSITFWVTEFICFFPFIIEEGDSKKSIKMKEMEGIASIALLPCGSISGHFIRLSHSTCYGLHGTGMCVSLSPLTCFYSLDAPFCFRLSCILVLLISVHNCVSLLYRFMYVGEFIRVSLPKIFYYSKSSASGQDYGNTTSLCSESLCKLKLSLYNLMR